MFRRGFLKLSTSAAGLMLFSTPLLKAMPRKNDWIEDRGDFYIVRVPERRTFGVENFDKPVIFQLGVGALVTRVVVNGCTKVYASKFGASIHDSRFDARNCRLTSGGIAIALCGGSAESPLLVTGCDFLA